MFADTNSTTHSASLLEVLGAGVPMTDYCGSGGAYRNWEEKFATPALEAKGYKVLAWYTTDQDSCGPLVREAQVVKEGVKSVLWYG